MHQRRRALRGRMLPVLVALCAILAGGCAGQGSPAGDGQPSGASLATRQPRTTTVTLRDAGRTVTLRVGDRLDVGLGTSRQTGDEWRLISYPEALLSLLPAPAGHYRFAAAAPGRGILAANPTLVCAPTDNPNPVLCPPTDARTRATPQRPPRTRFRLTIQVSR
ncbi:MAG TPA: hypothetical protein VF486_16640 [Actinomycetes bacterium]